MYPGKKDASRSLPGIPSHVAHGGSARIPLEGVQPSLSWSSSLSRSIHSPEHRVILHPSCVWMHYASAKPRDVTMCLEAYRGSGEATKELFRICRLMWNTERIPANLVRGMFVMIHKKGSRNDYGNYRAICLLCHSYKLMSAVVARIYIDGDPVRPSS